MGARTLTQSFSESPVPKTERDIQKAHNKYLLDEQMGVELCASAFRSRYGLAPTNQDKPQKRCGLSRELDRPLHTPWPLN